MSSLLRRILAPPTIADADPSSAETGPEIDVRASRLRLLHYVTLAMSLIFALAILILAVARLNGSAPFDAVVAFFFISLSAHIYNRHIYRSLQDEKPAAYAADGSEPAIDRRPELLSLFLIISSLILTTILIANLGAVDQPFFYIYLVITVFAGLLLGPNLAVLTGLASLAAGAIMILNSGLGAPAWQAWFTHLVNFSLTISLIYLVMKDLHTALTQQRTAQFRLQKRTVELQALRLSLEQNVAERTTDLERRNTYLEAAAEVARIAAAYLSLDDLESQIVEVILQRFDLYYVGLFLVDEAHEWAVLQAAAGDASKAMLARRHRIRIGAGMIGWSIANSQPRIALTAAEDLYRLATPELPDTRSEAALPLRSRGQVLGAISIQSTIPNAFDQMMLNVLQIMADQIAIAIDNARLFGQSQAALHAAQTAQSQLTGQAWKSLAHRQPGYRYQHQRLTPLSDGWQPELRQVLESGQPQIVSPGAEPAEEIILPLKVRNQPVGVLSFRKKGGKNWLPDEISLLQALLEQVAQAIESARLYDETRRQAERERLTGEVTARMRATLDIDSVLQTAVDEIYQVLNLDDLTVWLSPTDLEQPASHHSQPAELPSPSKNGG